MIGDESACASQLGAGCGDEPAPSFGLSGCAQAWAGPAEMLFEEPEHVLDTESAEVSTPDSIQIEGVAGAGPPQPQRLEAMICRVKADQVAVHDVTIGWATAVVGVFVVLRAGFEVKVVPAGHGHRGVALVSWESDGVIGFRPTVRVGQFHLRPVSPRSSVGSWFPGGWLGEGDGVAA